MEKLFGFANVALLVSVAGLVGTILLAYPFAGVLPLAGQVVAHIGTLLFAVGIKLAYVARLVSLRHLGRPAHG